MTKPYPAAFRRQDLALLYDGRTVRDVAVSPWVADSWLHRCKRQQPIDQGLASDLSDSDRCALTAAKQWIREFGGGSQDPAQSCCSS